uniref:hypothetical protein n=1 Tax=Spirosoma arboris TaxID=2682092 RepID=UPI001D0F57C3|nr:hypothetical protein [Spirosoma arboris]
MTDKALAIYCLLDDMFQIMGPKTDPHGKLNDAEVATTALMAALSFYGNQARACDYRQHHMGCQMIDKSGFHRRLHRLEPTLLLVFQAMGLALKELNTSARYIIDSFPVAVCRNCRIGVSKLLTGRSYHGYHEAKKEYRAGGPVLRL